MKLQNKADRLYEVTQKIKLGVTNLIIKRFGIAFISAMMKLSDRIWITRKSRIESESRLKRNELLSQILIVYFSVCNIIFVILDIKDTNQDYSYQLLIASIITLSISIFLPSRRFAERALSFKKCYIGLYSLLQRANKLEKLEQDNLQGEEDSFDRIDSEYQDLLTDHENHSQNDYYVAVFNNLGPESIFHLKKTEWITLILYKLRRSVALLLFFGIPFLLWYYI